MRKHVLLTILLAIGLCSFAQQDSINIDTIKISETERIIDKYSGKIGDAIQALADQLEQPVEFVWECVVKQHFLEGIVNFSFIVFFIISLLLFINSMKTKGWKDNDTPNAHGVVSAVFAVASFILLIMTFAYFGDAITQTFNPEYHAIQDIFDLIKY